MLFLQVNSDMCSLGFSKCFMHYLVTLKGLSEDFWKAGVQASAQLYVLVWIVRLV